MESDPSKIDAVRHVLRDHDYSETSKQELCAAISNSGALARAREVAHDYAQAACTALECLPESPYREALQALPTYVLQRDR